MRAHDYLDKSVDYRYILGMHRDTLTSNGLDSYRRDIVDVQRLRAEAHVLKAYYYFELAKRYGGAPHRPLYADQKEATLPRGTFDEVVGLILREIEGVRNELVVDWRAENLEEKSGRITRGAALAPQVEGVALCRQPAVQSLGRKVQVGCRCRCGLRSDQHGHLFLHPDYGGLFVAETSTTSPETIWAVRMGGDQRVRTQELPHRHAGRRYGYLPFAEPRGSL